MKLENIPKINDLLIDIFQQSIFPSVFTSILFLPPPSLSHPLFQPFINQPLIFINRNI